MPRTCAFRPPARSLPAVLLLALVCLIPAAAHAADPPTIIAPVGSTAGDHLGGAVGAAGDVNGDGYVDVIVGASLEDTGGADAGRVYVYFGGPLKDAVPDLVLTGEAAGDQFGAAACAAGNVNGDRYADVIVGAPGSDAGGTDAGRVYVFHGGGSPDAVPDLTLTGAAAGDYFGGSVGGAGDVNGDGYADVIVGAGQNDAGGSNAGRAYVYLGGPGMDAVADVTLTGAAPADVFGFDVGTAGDVNGDGRDDVVVGAPYADTGGTNSGAAYVFYGGAVMDAVADLVLSGAAGGDYLGYSVGAAGDVNGDGHADVVAGAYANDAGGTNAGQAYVYLGGPGADGVADWTLTGEATQDAFGRAVAAAGDVNGDGHADVIVGAPWSDAGGTDAGRAYVFHGGPAADAVADLTLTGVAAYDYFGMALGSAGDVNVDGQCDLVVGAPMNDAAGSEAGAAYVYDLGPPGAAHRLAFTLPGAAANDYLGRSVGTAGDVNGDGYDDVIVGAPFHDKTSFGWLDSGEAYILHGGPGMDAVADWTLEGDLDRARFGNVAATAGDVNGDGYDDVIVGSHYMPVQGTLSGQAWVFFGGTSPDGDWDMCASAAAAYDRLGVSVGTAGDVNGDGYDDVIVGAPGDDGAGADAGRAYVFFGGASLDGVADLTLSGTVGEQLGESVGTAGDVNGDGFDDVIVGAPFNDAGGVNAGRAYVYFGGVSADAVADWTLTGTAAGDVFGTEVASAGDVDGDGYDDVIVGAPGDDAGGSNAGRAYVFRGGTSPDAVADLTLTGEAVEDHFGDVVGAAGDVNGDGHADLVVGAYGNDAGGADAGRAYVFHGGPVADTTADVVLTGLAAGDQFGWSVGTARDVRGDGFSDLVAGAYGNDAAGTDAGAAYVVDCDRYFVTYPNGGETFAGDGSMQVEWLGAEPADLWLSVDGGATYERLVRGMGGYESNAAEVTVPNVNTDQALVKVTPFEPWIGGSDSSDAVFSIEAWTGVGPESAELRFRAPWPNPSHGRVRFGLELARPTVVSVTVLDVAGREVARPIAGERFEAGQVEREWRPTDLAPGVYTVRAKVGDVKLTRRLVWLGGR